jgi:hypothetical protein
MAPAIGPAVRVAIKVAPVALEAARQLDRKIRPHVNAYQLARSIDGYVGSWTDGEGTHWVVFPDRDTTPIRAFPPLRADELVLVDEQIDRATLRHHAELPEAQVRQKAQQVVEAPGRLLPSRRGGS